MSFTREELLWCVAEIAAAIEGDVIDRVHDLGDETLVLAVRSHRADHHVLVSVRPGFTRAHLAQARPRGVASPSAFVMLLRKRLEGGRIEACALWGDDRVLRVRVRGEAQPLSLVCELTGRHGNVLLVEGDDDVIVASMRPNSSRLRALVPGAPYTAPLPLDGPARSHEADLAAAAIGASARIEPAAPSRSAEALYAHLLLTSHCEAAAIAIDRALREAEKRLRRRADAIADDRARAARAEPYHHLGTLLVSEVHRIRRGQAEARVTDWSLDPPAEVVVPLDPALTPKANVERLFARYRKYKDGRARIDAQERAVQQELAQWAALRARSPTLVSTPAPWVPGEAGAFEALTAHAQALDAFRAELVRRGLLRAEGPKVGAKARAREAPAEPFRRFVAQDGVAILVGKGASQNDVLTFKRARGNDLWLHARDYPGAHVVVPLGRGVDPHPETLLDAATLAAHYSDAKDAAVVDVSVTRCKHVRKLKGGPAGQVTLSEARTLAVRMEPERLQRLFRKQTLD